MANALEVEQLVAHLQDCNQPINTLIKSYAFSPHFLATIRQLLAKAKWHYWQQEAIEKVEKASWTRRRNRTFLDIERQQFDCVQRTIKDCCQTTEIGKANVTSTCTVTASIKFDYCVFPAVQPSFSWSGDERIRWPSRIQGTTLRMEENAWARVESKFSSFPTYDSLTSLN